MSSSQAAPSAATPVTKESRRAQRHRVRIEVTVDLKTRRTKGVVHDISTTGMRVDLEHSFFGPPGCSVSLESKELGRMECIVRWNRGTRLGLSFLNPTASSAQVHAYFRFFQRKS